MTTYYAKNATMNLTDANAWNTAANGSGTDWTYEAGANVLHANGKTVTLDADVSCSQLTHDATAGGTFALSGAVTRAIVADLLATKQGAATPTTATALITVAAGQTLNITGNATAQTSLYSCAVWNNGGTVNLTGNCVGTSTYAATLFNSSGTATVTGNPLGTGYGRAVQVSGGTVNINGNPVETASGAAVYTPVNITGGTCNLTGLPTSVNGGPSIYIAGGVLNWKNQTVTLSAGAVCRVALYSGTLDVSGLVVNNSGNFSVTRDSNQTFTTDGTTRVFNRTATAQAAGINCTLPVTNFSTPQFGGRRFKRG